MQTLKIKANGVNKGKATVSQKAQSWINKQDTQGSCYCWGIKDIQMKAAKWTKVVDKGRPQGKEISVKVLWEEEQVENLVVSEEDKAL